MKILRNAVLLLLVLLILVAAAILLPAHRQIRAVNAALPAAAEFEQLRRANGPINIYYVNTAQQQLPDSVLTHSAFVLEWADGQLFLIDTGMTEAAAEEFGDLMKLVLSAEQAKYHGTIADTLGSDVTRVKGVGFTHLHSDHAEGLSTLCAAGDINPMLLQTRNQQLEHNFNTSESARQVQESCLNPVGLDAGLVYTSEHFPGLGLVPVAGHTPGATLFAAWLGDQLFLFSGDITNNKRELQQDLGKGWVYSNLLVPEDTQRTSQLRRWLRKISTRDDVSVVVSHDLVDIKGSGLQPFVATAEPQAEPNLTIK